MEKEDNDEEGDEKDFSLPMNLLSRTKSMLKMRCMRRWETEGRR